MHAVFRTLATLSIGLSVTLIPLSVRPANADQTQTKLTSLRPIVDTRLPYPEQWSNIGDLLKKGLRPLRAASINVPLVEDFGGGSTSPAQLRQAKAVARQLEGDFIWGDIGKGVTGLFVHNRSSSTVSRLVLRSTDGECDSRGKKTYFVVAFSSDESLKPSEAALFLTELDYPAGFFPQSGRPDSWCTEIVRAF